LSESGAEDLSEGSKIDCFDGAEVFDAICIEFSGSDSADAFEFEQSEEFFFDAVL